MFIMQLFINGMFLKSYHKNRNSSLTSCKAAVFICDTGKLLYYHLKAKDSQSDYYSETRRKLYTVNHDNQDGQRNGYAAVIIH